ncbi:MAG: TetR family transcriptional regulator [Gammaproteobacteria bacterium]|nr:TetR family transcriptional regulator [Gammaproteobacteria bacterium]MDE0284196.1 TetR family transcriptional regulator [Gammaproteobacteria bacterium]MDE0513928.1 TetR family transcriptional regulator [Gammaproteobacteria bacterium]
MSSLDTQEKIKARAISLFNEHGTGSVSIGRIASEAGISRGHLQYHYANKQELIRAIYQDIAAEVLSNWEGDDKQPTVRHMAEMFVRQFHYVWKYRFLYREMVTLIRVDSELARRIRDNRARRIEAVIKFFRALARNRVLKKLRGEESLRYLVMITWIFCDNWLNFIEIQGNEINSQTLQEGYDHIIEMLYPYLTRQARESIYESYELIRFPQPLT